MFDNVEMERFEYKILSKQIKVEDLNKVFKRSAAQKTAREMIFIYYMQQTVIH